MSKVYTQDSTSSGQSFQWSDWLGSRWLYHFLFWVAVLVLLVSFDDSAQSLHTRLTNELINVLFYASIVYFNLYYLIPNYLNKKRFLNYAVLLIACDTHHYALKDDCLLFPI